MDCSRPEGRRMSSGWNSGWKHAGGGGSELESVATSMAYFVVSLCIHSLKVYLM